jgi:hypothetical protein
METEVSLPCTQEPSTGPCTERDESSLSCFTIHFNIILPSNCSSGKRSLSFMFWNQPACVRFSSPMRGKKSNQSSAVNHLRRVKYWLNTTLRTPAPLSLSGLTQVFNRSFTRLVIRKNFSAHVRRETSNVNNSVCPGSTVLVQETTLTHILSNVS